MTTDGTEPASGRGGRRRAVAVVGVLLVAIGLGLLGYVGWQYFGTNIVAKQKHQDLIAGLERDWTRSSASADEEMQARAILRIERFGADYTMPIVEGVDDRGLASGVGHFRDSADPGEIGNYALAGHRVTHGEPFKDFLKLRTGDEVVVETRRFEYTYVLDDDGADRTVDFSESWVLDPNPYDPGSRPKKRLITLVTCSELFHTDNRQAVFGHLKSVERKARG